MVENPTFVLQVSVFLPRHALRIERTKFCRCNILFSFEQFVQINNLKSLSS